MSLPDKICPLKFDKITRYSHGEWPENWLEECSQGDLLLSPGDPWPVYGFLCIDDLGVFLTLNRSQIVSQAPIPWPNNVSRIESVQIIGDRLKIKKSV